MIKQTLPEWLNEGQNLFGKDKKHWAFRCPKCEKKQTIQDFIDRDIDPNNAYQDCLGRHDESIDCDWAAYGLFGTLGKGRTVVNEGKEIEVFDYWKEEQNG
jgi:hypothetical protein